MIRPWSSLNFFNYNLKIFQLTLRKTSIVLFKNSVYLKRFKPWKSKFKRKIIARWKHKSSWTLYFNVLKYWSIDYQFNRQLLRYQILNYVFNDMYTVYNYNFVKKHINRDLCETGAFLTTVFTKTKLKYFTSKVSNLNTNNFINTSVFYLFSTIKPESKTNQLLLKKSELVLYTQSFQNTNYNLTNIYELVENIFMKKILELYKIVYIHILLNI